MTSRSVLLSQLFFDMKHNSRSGLDEEAMKELMQSIEANGLITPLTVRPTGAEVFAVIDGHRRLEALNRLYQDKRESYHVPVLVRVADDKDAVVMSLAANIVRLPLHPADQYKAFAKMLDEGMEREAIAARFNLDLKAVERILALGRVIPAALEHFRNGKIDTDTIRLFASASEERQLAVWKKAYEDDQLTRWQVQRLLQDNTISGNSPVAQLVGEEAYEKAGGRIERSLFNAETRWLDVQLAAELADAAFAAKVEALKEEGWAFVMADEDMPKQWRSWQREYADRILTPEQQAEIEAKDKRIEEIDEIDEDTLSSEQNDELTAERDRLADELQLIEQSAPYGFTAEQKAATGVVICEGYTLAYGVKKPEKVKLDAPEKKPEPEKKGWSETLLNEVDAYGTVAAQLAIMREPAVADAMLLAGMYQDTVMNATPVRVMALNSADRFSNVEINAGKEITAALKGFGLKGSEFWPLFDTIKGWDQETRDRLRAVLVARAMKMRRGKELEAVLPRLQTTDLLATWKPEKEFFARLNTAQLSEIYKELTGFELKEGTKKLDAVAMVAVKAAAANWVPKHLRGALKQGTSVTVAPPKKPKKAEKGDVITTVVGEDGKTAAVKRKKAA